MLQEAVKKRKKKEKKLQENHPLGAIVVDMTRL